MFLVNRNSDSFLYKNPDMSIGARVREARKDAKLTQEQLAKRVGIRQSTLSELENGESAGTGYVATMAAALGVSPLWLETGKGPKKLKSSPAELTDQAGNAMLPVNDMAELITLYSRSSPEWKRRIMDLAKRGAQSSPQGPETE